MAINYPWAPQVMTPVGGYSNPYGQLPMNSIFWVSGEAGANAYRVLPNTSVLLMDQESNKFYVKSADLLGIPTIRTYEYTELVNSVVPATKTAEVTKEEPEQKLKEDKVEYVSRKEFNELKKSIDELMS